MTATFGDGLVGGAGRAGCTGAGGGAGSWRALFLSDTCALSLEDDDDGPEGNLCGY